MLDCIMCITNEGTLEKVRLSPSHWATIDRITVKMASGKRLRRYAVRIDGRWKSNQQMTLREARDEIARLQHDYSVPKFKPLTIEEMRQVAKDSGPEQAYNILLLGGYGFIEGTCKDYDDLLKEFETECKKGREMV